MSMNGWVGFDLDGTLAEYTTWQGEEYIGAPIPPMVERLQAYLARGVEVRIFTARVGPGCDIERALPPIERWCEEHLGVCLPVTATKDFGMALLYDDRCKQVIPNTGVLVEEAAQ